MFTTIVCSSAAKKTCPTLCGGTCCFIAAGLLGLGTYWGTSVVATGFGKAATKALLEGSVHQERAFQSFMKFAEEESAAAGAEAEAAGHEARAEELKAQAARETTAAEEATAAAASAEGEADAAEVAIGEHEAAADAHAVAAETQQAQAVELQEAELTKDAAMAGETLIPVVGWIADAVEAPVAIGIEAAAVTAQARAVAETATVTSEHIAEAEAAALVAAKHDEAAASETAATENEGAAATHTAMAPTENTAAAEEQSIAQEQKILAAKDEGSAAKEQVAAIACFVRALVASIIQFVFSLVGCIAVAAPAVCRAFSQIMKYLPCCESWGISYSQLPPGERTAHACASHTLDECELGNMNLLNIRDNSSNQNTQNIVRQRRHWVIIVHMIMCATIIVICSVPAISASTQILEKGSTSKESTEVTDPNANYEQYTHFGHVSNSSRFQKMTASISETSQKLSSQLPQLKVSALLIVERATLCATIIAVVEFVSKFEQHRSCDCSVWRKAIKRAFRSFGATVIFVIALGLLFLICANHHHINMALEDSKKDIELVGLVCIMVLGGLNVRWRCMERLPERAHDDGGSSCCQQLAEFVNTITESCANSFQLAVTGVAWQSFSGLLVLFANSWAVLRLMPFVEDKINDATKQGSEDFKDAMQQLILTTPAGLVLLDPVIALGLACGWWCYPEKFKPTLTILYIVALCTFGAFAVYCLNWWRHPREWECSGVLKESCHIVYVHITAETRTMWNYADYYVKPKLQEALNTVKAQSEGTLGGMNNRT